MKITKVTSLLSLTAGLVLLSACKKDKVEPTPTTPVVLTSEQNKTNLQQTGLDFMKQMDDAKNLPSVDNTIYFTDLLNTANPFEEAKPASIMPFKILYALRSFEKNGNQEIVAQALRTTKTLEEDSTILMVFNDIKGTYEWNSTTQIWDKSEGSSLVLKFPSNESKTTNNASYVIEYTPYNGNVYNSDLEGNTPQKVVAKLSVDSKVLIQFDFNGAYNSSGIPSSLEANLKVEGYNFNSKLTLSNQLVSNNYAFTHNGSNIISMGTSLNGDFTKEHLQSLNEESVSKYEDINKIATNISTYIQVLNVKLQGTGNINGIVNDITSKGGSDKVKIDGTVEILNKNLVLKAFYVNNGVKIAHSEFFKTSRQETYWVYNQNTGTYDEKTKNVDVLDARLVFDDASKVDLETYFNEGFEKLDVEFEKFLTDLDSRYGN